VRKLASGILVLVLIGIGAYSMFDSEQTQTFNNVVIDRLDKMEGRFLQLETRIKKEAQQAQLEEREIDLAQFRVDEFNRQVQNDMKMMKGIEVPDGEVFQNFYDASLERGNILLALGTGLQEIVDQSKASEAQGFDSDQFNALMKDQMAEYVKCSDKIMAAQKQMAKAEGLKLKEQ